MELFLALFCCTHRTGNADAFALNKVSGPHSMGDQSEGGSYPPAVVQGIGYGGIETYCNHTGRQYAELWISYWGTLCIYCFTYRQATCSRDCGL